jgi:hypothetical protein
VYGLQAVEVGGLYAIIVRAGVGESRDGANLISDLAAPVNHLRDSLLVHSPAGLADSVHDGEIGLEGV